MNSQPLPKLREQAKRGSFIQRINKIFQFFTLHLRVDYARAQNHYLSFNHKVESFFVDFGLQKSSEIWQFSGKFG